MLKNQVFSIWPSKNFRRINKKLTFIIYNENMSIYIQKKQEEINSIIEHFRKEISTIRTGRANPSVLDGIYVDSYGVKTPLNGLGNIGIADAQSLTVTPWDRNIMKDIERAISEANLGLGVVNDGDKIRLTVPRMTEEVRKEMVKKLNEKMEDSRIKVRKIRDEIKSDIEKAEKDKEIGEDDKFRFIKELDVEIGKLNDKIKELRDKKEVDVMTI